MTQRKFEIWPTKKRGERSVGKWEDTAYPKISDGDGKQVPEEFAVRREIRRLFPGQGINGRDTPRSILVAVDRTRPEEKKPRSVTIHGGVGPINAKEEGPHYIFEGTLEEVKGQVDEVLREAGVTLY